eukprot:COSAG01_NODE_5932_length_3946_cov_1.712763_1_plen_76_part_00
MVGGAELTGRALLAAPDCRYELTSATYAPAPQLVHRDLFRACAADYARLHSVDTHGVRLRRSQIVDTNSASGSRA